MKSLIVLALTFASTAALADNLQQFVGRYKTSSRKCNIGEGTTRAYVKISGRDRAYVEIQFFGADASVAQIEANNATIRNANRSNAVKETTYSYRLAGDTLESVTSYVYRNGRTEAAQHQILRRAGNKLIYTNNDRQMPRPYYCELVRE